MHPCLDPGRWYVLSTCHHDVSSTRMKKIAILGFLLESNRFAPVTTRSDFDARCWLEGADILTDAVKDAPRQCAEIPAFLAEIHRLMEVEIIPVLVAGAEPGGPLDDAVLREVVDKTCAKLAAEGPFDGVYIASHGAMVGVKESDPDGALLAAVRGAIGPDVPLLATLDLHANLSDRMAEAADCLIGYRTNPHVDQAEIAREAAGVLARMINGTAFHMSVLRLPLTPASVTLLTNGPGAYAECVEHAARLIDVRGDIVNATVLGGFVYSDTPDNGIAVLVTATHQHVAQREASYLAGRLWADRHRFTHRLTSIDEAIGKITAEDDARWILADSGDNPGGGGRGTSTDLLAAMCAANAEGVLYGLYIDAELAQEATEAGLGGHLNARFLRNGPKEFGPILEMDAKVIALSDGRVVGRRGLVAGRRVELGPTAALRLGGIDVVVTSHRKQCADPVYFEHMGFDPADYRAVDAECS